MFKLGRQIIILFLVLIPTMAGTSAAEAVTLLQVTKNDSLTDSRITLHFSGLPAYRIAKSGQRLDLFMQDVTFAQAFKILPEDHTIVKMEQQIVGNRTTLSFLLRRPMLQIDSSFILPNKNKDAATRHNPVQLVLILHWQDISRQTSISNLPKDRPAILQETTGTLQTFPDRATATHAITSEYAGQWSNFLKEYETEVSIPVPFHYSLPPFPALALVTPAGTQSVVTVNCQELIRLSRTEGWHQVANNLEGSVRNMATEENRDELLILYGEALIRAGFSDRAREILVKLHNSLPDSPIGKIAGYLAVYSSAALGKPYDAAYELSLMQQDEGDAKLTPYLDLLQAEIALATDNIDKAKVLLQKKGRLYLGQVRRLFDLRRADMLFSAGQIDAAFSLYRALTGADHSSSTSRAVEAFAFDQARSAHEDILADHPTSLTKYAATLYKKGDYQSALKQYINLTASLYDQPEQNLALYTVAMSQYHLGNTKEAGLILEDVIEKFPASEGSFRARLKLNDLFVLADLENEKLQPNILHALRAEKSSSSPNNGIVNEQNVNADTSSPKVGNASKQDDFPGFDPALEYADIAAKAPLRALREEAAFKHALTYYFTTQYEESVKLLQDFIRTNQSGQLIQEAEALLVEILPMVVKDKIANKDYVDALALAEQNRAILIGGRVKGDFLAELGIAFASLCFWNRAVRVYLYMMDIAKDKQEEETVYLPLVRAYYEKNDLAQVEEYCHRYLADFPDGDDRAAIMHLQISALYNNGRTDEALRLLKKSDLPQSPDLQELAGRIFYEAGDYKMAEKHLARLMTTGLNHVESEAILMRAEALFRSDRGVTALPLYRHLEIFAAFADQAAYRIAQIHMAADDRSAGLKLLQTLVENAKSPLWRKMATETLAMETI